VVWERQADDLQMIVDGLGFPEGPRWHDDQLWFSDMPAHQVLRVDLETAGGRPEPVLTLADDPSGLGWLPDGRLLVVSMRERKLLRLDPTGELATVADLSAHATGNCNDMVVDGSGRAYVGNFGFDMGQEEPRGAVLCRVDPDGTVTPVADGLEFPNGTVLSPDGSTLIVAESYGHRLTAFTVAGDGGLGDRRVFAALGGAAPDGICLDAEGAVWAASPVSKEVLRVADGGTVLGRITTGERRPIACMLAGPDRQTLVICTVGRHREMQERGGTGRLEVLDVPVPGAGLP
jgi:sugar lactone lactonase YvrE